MTEDMYIVVTDNDGCDGGPMAIETYIDKASMKNAKAIIDRLGGRYGKCRIAKLNFIEINEESLNG